MRKSKRKLKNTLRWTTITQNLWDATKAVLRGKFIAIQVFLIREEKSQIDNLTRHLNELDEEEQTKPKVSKRKEIIKIKDKVNKIEIWKKNREKNQKNQWVNEKNQEKFTNSLRQVIMKTQTFKIYGMLQKQFLEGSS